MFAPAAYVQRAYTIAVACMNAAWRILAHMNEWENGSETWHKTNTLYVATYLYGAIYDDYCYCCFSIRILPPLLVANVKRTYFSASTSGCGSGFFAAITTYWQFIMVGNIAWALIAPI